MTIREMTIAQWKQERNTGTHTAAEIAEAHQRAHKQAGTIEGMCMDCYKDHIHDEVALPGSVIQQVKDAAFVSKKDSYGWNDTDYLSPIVKSYIQTIEPEKRIASSRALQKVWREESDRIGWYIHSKDPSWTNWGQKFDLSILDDYKQGIDIKA